MTLWTGIDPGPYPAILVDAPWRFKVWSDKGDNRAPKYRRMSHDEIKALPVADLAAPDTFLFFWTSGNQLPRAFDIIKTWGFTYSSTAFVWVKLNPHGHELFWSRRSFFMGQGYTTRKNVELCLLARRGKPQRLSKGVEELIIAPRRRHSEKPDETYMRVEQFAAGPYVELFSRKTRRGWQMFGDQAGSLGEVAA